MGDNQANRDYGEGPTTIVFNNRSHAKGRIEIHGGTPQRAGMRGAARQCGAAAQTHAPPPPPPPPPPPRTCSAPSEKYVERIFAS